MSEFQTKRLFTDCPEFFQDFQKACCCSADSQAAAKASGLEIKSDYGSQYYVEGLAHVARHWRIANALTEIKAYLISEEVRDANLALLKNQMSIATLERYAAIYQKKWSNFDLNLLPELHPDFTARLRSILRESPAKKIKPENYKLNQRLKKFKEGDDCEILGVSVALRNSFAHGKIWGANDLQPEVLKLADGVLAALQTHVENKIKELDP